MITQGFLLLDALAAVGLRLITATGKGVIPGIHLAATQYGVRDHFLDCLTFDVTRGPWRRGGWIDAIITDPPCKPVECFIVLRSSCRWCTSRSQADRKERNQEDTIVRETPYYVRRHILTQVSPISFHFDEVDVVASRLPGYIPPFRPYELAHLTLDLILLARYLLVPKGRLVFFLPTVTEEYSAIDIPVVNGMRELKIGEGSVQDFGKWSRRVSIISLMLLW